MARFLKQSTTFTFRAGPFVDSTDGVTAETALSIAQADIQISKAGAAFAQTSAASPTTTHDADGWYQCPLTATDTGTVGALTVQIAMAGALPVWHDFMVLPANVYDSLMGTDLLDVSVTQWTGTAVAAVDTAGYPKVTIKSGTGTGEISLSSGRVLLQSGLRKNQAVANFPFVMTDSTNHNPLTGLTVTATRSIDGAAFASGTIANMTEVSNGAYQCDLGAGDLNGDTIILRFTATGADDLFVSITPDP